MSTPLMMSTSVWAGGQHRFSGMCSDASEATASPEEHQVAAGAAGGEDAYFPVALWSRLLK